MPVASRASSQCPTDSIRGGRGQDGWVRRGGRRSRPRGKLMLVRRGGEEKAVSGTPAPGHANEIRRILLLVLFRRAASPGSCLSHAAGTFGKRASARSPSTSVLATLTS